MNLRVLVWSNPLVVDKISKKFLYWKDSGFIYTKHLINSMPKNYRFYWVVPDKLKAEDLGWFLEANENVELIFYPYSTSIHQNRYEFYGNVLKENFPYVKDIDVIINNQPEVSANLRVWAENQRRDRPIILSFYHWIDCAESRKFAEGLGGYYLRQYDGALASDRIFFHSDYAYGLFEKTGQEYFLQHTKFHFSTFHPPATKFGTQPFEFDTTKKIILFNHRLNNTTNWKPVVETLANLWKKRQDFVLWITDDSKIQEKKYLESIPFVIVKSLPSEQYGFLIKNSWFGICNHVGYSTWNMAAIDSFYNGCFMIIPNDPCYRSMFGRKFTGYHDAKNSGDLFLICDSLLNQKKDRIEKFIDNTLKTAPAFVDRDDEIDVEKMIECKLDHAKTPAKYDLVLDAIGKGISKKDLVNGLWTFHVNSNFQKIRWSLLNDGIHDDTTQSETYYTKE